MGKAKGKGVTCSVGATVYALAVKVLKAAPQLEGAVKHCLPRGHVGKWLMGRVDTGAGKLKGEPQWVVQFTGIAAKVTIGRRSFSLEPPPLLAAVFTGHCAPAAAAAAAVPSAARETAAETTDDVVTAGNVEWHFQPDGVRPSVRAAVDNTDSILDGEAVKIAAPLLALIEKLKKDRTNGQLWRDLFTMLFPGDLGEVTANMNKAASLGVGHHTKLRKRPVTEQELLNVVFMFICGCVRPGKGRKAYFAKATGYNRTPGLGEFMHEDRFRAICSVLPFGWCTGEAEMKMAAEGGSNKYGWGMLRPLTEAFNYTRNLLFEVMKTVFDEDMISFCPKTSPTGCLNHITNEPRKPVPIGSMLRSLCCAILGIKMVLEWVEEPAEQHKKRHYSATQAFKGGQGCGAGTDVMARMLEQMNTKEVPPPEDSPRKQRADQRAAATAGQAIQPAPVQWKRKAGLLWIGDAYFGNVNGMAYLTNKFGVVGQALVKNCSANYCKAAMLERLASKERGSTVVALATVEGVEMMAVGYKFSLSRPPNLFLATVGSSADGGTYFASFDNDDGVTETAPLPRPQVAEQYFGTQDGAAGSTACDDHNHRRQNELDVCRNWHLEDGWLHHVIEIVAGYTFIDMHLLARHVGLSAVDETTVEFANRILALGYTMVDYFEENPSVVARAAAPELLQFPTHKIDCSPTSKAFKAGRQQITKQEQHACIECLATRQEQHAAAGSVGTVNQHFGGKGCPASAYYCSVCAAKPDASRESCAIHHCDANGRKRKRSGKNGQGDPYASCWANHCHRLHNTSLVPEGQRARNKGSASY